MVRQCIICKTKNGCGLVLKQVPNGNDSGMRELILNAIDRITLLHTQQAIYLCSTHYPQIQNPFLTSPLESSAFSSSSSFVQSNSSPSSTHVSSSSTSRNTFSPSIASTPLSSTRQISPSSVPSNVSALTSTAASSHASTSASSSLRARSSSIIELQIQLQRANDEVKKLREINKRKNVAIHRFRTKNAQLEQAQNQVPSFEELCKQKLEEPLLSVVLDHVKNKGKPAQAHRYRVETKRFALSLQYISPKAMRLLRLNFKIILPSPSTVFRLTSNWNLDEGFNQQMIDALKAATSSFQGAERAVVLSLDEMAIDPDVMYDRKNDRILGLGAETAKGFKIAKHVLVFMVSYHFQPFEDLISL